MKGAGRAPSIDEEVTLDLVYRQFLAAPGWDTYQSRAAALGMHPRKFRLAVQKLVRKGRPIATSSVDGYCLETNPVALRAAAGKMRHRGLAILERAGDLDRMADALEVPTAGQPDLFPVPSGTPVGIGSS